MNLAPQLVKFEDHGPTGIGGNESTLNVLVVDDTFDDFLTIERFLRMPYRLRYNAVYCDSYDKAVAEIRSGNFDVALLDEHLGEHRGTDLIKAFEGNPPVPVIILTGTQTSEFDEIENEALDAGAFDILDKHDLSCAALTRSIGFARKRFETEWEIRQRELEIRRAHEEAEAAHFSKSEFLAVSYTHLTLPTIYSV